jgi:hypothetical protein
MEFSMKLSILSSVIMFTASGVLAQHDHQSNLPLESGQSQFAAIAEIVELLRDDPKTDWPQVNINALREHLVDMDNLTTQAKVDQSIADMHVTFTITGDGLVAKSIQRMILAHSKMLTQSSNWPVIADSLPNGATMTIQARSSEELDQILGLGFFGVMTVGAHHQQHHVMIAKGSSPH